MRKLSVHVARTPRRPRSMEHSCPGIIAIGALRSSGLPLLIGSGFHVHADGTSCTDAHVVLDVCDVYRRNPAAYLNPGDPDFARVAIGFGNPVKWQFSAYVCKISYPPTDHPQMQPGGIAAGRTPGLDLAVLRLTDRYPLGGQLSTPLTAADGSLITVLPFADAEPALNDAISLAGYGYPDTISRNSGNPSVTGGVYSGELRDANGAWLKTDAVMLAGHSGGPGLNAAGQIVGWSVQSAMDSVTGGHGSVPAGINLLRPIGLLREFIASVLAPDVKSVLNPAARLLVYASVGGRATSEGFPGNCCGQEPGHEANTVGACWAKRALSNVREASKIAGSNLSLLASDTRSASLFAASAREFSFVHYAGAAALYQGQYVLTFTTAPALSGSKETPSDVQVLPQADIVQMLAGRDLVFLSADHSLEIGEALIRQGVRNVVCYQKGVTGEAAFHLAHSFWTKLRQQLDGDYDLARDRPTTLREAIKRAFDAAKLYVSTITKPGGECTLLNLDGQPAQKRAVSVPKYTFTNPVGDAVTGNGPSPAGVPVLLPREAE